MPEEHSEPKPFIQARIKPNSGHGHVRPRPDGHKARCGGPRICGVCAREVPAIDGTGALVTATSSENPSSDSIPPAVVYSVSLNFSLRYPLVQQDAMALHGLFDEVLSLGRLQDKRDLKGRSGYVVKTSRTGRAFTPLEIATEMQSRLHTFLREQGNGHPMFHGVAVQETGIEDE